MNSSVERRAIFLREMGLGPIWQRRVPTALNDSHPASNADQPAAATDNFEQQNFAVQPSHLQQFQTADQPIHEAPADQTSVRTTLVKPQNALTASAANQSVDSKPSAEQIAAMGWPELKAAVATCTKCPLCQSRTQSVFGVGDENAQWLLVGEGPGRTEDARGEPFVGPAGKLLDNMLSAINLQRGRNTYIANVVKCRPTDANGRDRAPSAPEIETCMPYLARQVELLQPELILALGKIAAIGLLQVDPATAVSKLRNLTHQYANRQLLVTYHPAYLLRNPADKSKAWADLCRAVELQQDLTRTNA